MNSIIQKEKCCYLCDEFEGYYNVKDLESHHIFGGTSNRRQSEKYGLKVWLCAEHHRNGKASAHHSRIIARTLHEVGQRAFEKRHGTREEFMKIFGRNYL